MDVAQRVLNVGCDAEVRHCNSAGGCSAKLDIPFLLPTCTGGRDPDKFVFSPNPMRPGNTSNVWTVPSNTSSVYLKVDYKDGSRKNSAGDIEVRQVRSGQTTRTWTIDSESDSGQLTGVASGSQIRVHLEKDAWDTDASEVTLSFHSGASASGNVIAEATLQKERQPNQPRNGRVLVDNERPGSVTLTWDRGPALTGARPHHYEVVVSGTNYVKRDIFSSNAEVSHQIPNACSITGLQGSTRTAQVSHCNAAGGCSLPLNISVGLPTCVNAPTPPRPPTRPPQQPIPPKPTNLKLELDGNDPGRLNLTYRTSRWSGGSTHHYQFKIEWDDNGTWRGTLHLAG